MKYVVNQITEGEDELILNYKAKSSEVEAILLFMDKKQRKIMGKEGDTKVLVSPEEMLYAESVDNKTFVYTKDKVIQTDSTLAALALFLDDIQYFRCSKSMIVNIDRVARLKSLSSNRIDATLENGEHIMISRTYASEFRKILKGDFGYEG